MAKGKKTGGRKAGTPNATTTAAKTAIEAAAEGLGGVARLIAWAQEDKLNERVFWGQIYPKLLPLQVTGSEGKDLVPQTVTLVITKVPGADCKP
jgi:hypothetical protein